MRRTLALLLALSVLAPATALGADCCTPKATPGCPVPYIEDCVCVEDPFCCDTMWDQNCVLEVEEYFCGSCDAGSVCGDDWCDWDEDCASCPSDCGECDTCGDDWCDWDEDCASCPQDCGPCGGGGDCCTDTGTPGCDDPTIQGCVCAQDPYCCSTNWDDTCAAEVEDFFCGDCGGGPSCGDDWCDFGEDCDSCPADCGECAACGDGWCDMDEDCQSCPEDCGACGGIGDCCEVQDGPGCGDPSVQACVCAEDSFCCEFVWDDVCVGEVDLFGCGDCAGTGPTCGDGTCDGVEDCIFCPEDCGACPGGDCCNTHAGSGCSDGAVQSCVCAEDAWCCDVEWDVTCVLEVTSFQCGTCQGGTVPVCGDGACKAGETCNTCPADCGPCGGTGDCCTAHEATGCDNPMVQGCVCQQDAYCCQVAWDDTCAGEVVELGCGICGGCVPNCNGKDCGGDGCGSGTTCGQCPPSESCQAGKCVAGCLPDCAGLECGSDGCGGSCGDCPPGRECKNGDCVPTCLPSCTGKQCGDDGCGGKCGTCPPGFFCEGGHCNDQCNPSCTGKECGPDGCGGSCGQCPGGFFCQQGKCDIQCAPDCHGKQCGDDGCGGACGTCPAGYSCDPIGHCKQGCSASCTGKQCGDDGCGGSCGTCPGGQTCNATGHCVEGCTPSCTGKQCGPDGCGGTCGACGFGYHCNMTSFVCEQDNTCTPDCHGKQCGDDSCGGACGTCPAGYLCGDSFKCAPDMPVGEDTTTPEEDITGPGPGGCPEGTSLLYDNCVPDKDLNGGTSGGCAAAGTDPSPAAPWLFGLMVFGLWISRGTRRARSSQ
ncbi:MAG: hypothetical protein ABIK09_18770 [Pseudomonadota bacterium]